VSLKDKFKKLIELSKSVPEPQDLPKSSLSDVVFPIIRRPVVFPLDPIQKSIDYQGSTRKSILVEGFYCSECDMMHPDKDYVHSDEECTTYKVMCS
jgi:hypothetical protein